MAKEYKLDIFKLLAAIDKGDYHYYDKLSDEEKKDFSPLVVMRWMSGTDDPRQTIFLNELANPIVYSLNKHPGLMYKLLVCSSSKVQHRYKWVGNKKGSTKPKSLEVIKKYYGYSTRAAEDVRSLLSAAAIIEMAEELAYQKDEITKLKAELK